jgi:serine/threonine-protein kinase RsbW
MNAHDDLRGEVLMERHFDRDTLAETRTAVYSSAVEAGAPDERAWAFTTSVAEGMNNAIMHGGGSGEVTMCRAGTDGVVAEVRDWGNAEPFEIPSKPPPPGGMGGRGLWLASQLCDRVMVLRGWRGTSLILELSFAT